MMYDMQPPRATPLREPPAPRAPKKTQKKTGTKCPSGFYFDKKKGRCVQAGVGPEFKP
tara:strand:+ start:926 stop:1099 length:174 start_codon:yes stop_codon:yes gene_type:complete